MEKESVVMKDLTETTTTSVDVDSVTAKVSEMSTAAGRSETPVENWTKRQLARHRALVHSYELGGKPLPDALKVLDLTVKEIHPKKNPLGASGSGPGGGKGESSGTGGTKGTKRKHNRTGTTPNTAGKRSREALDSDSGQEKIADMQSTAGYKSYLVCGNPITPMSEQQIKCVTESISFKINDMALKCADDPETIVPDISLTPSGLGIRAITGGQESFDWLVKYAGSANGLWQGCRLRVLGEEELPQMHRVEGVFFPPVPNQLNILTILNRLNSRLNIKDWRIVGRSVNGSSGVSFDRFELTDKDFEALKAENFRVRLGTCTYVLKEHK